MGKHGRRRLLCTSPRSVTSRVALVPELTVCAAHPRFCAASIPKGGGGAGGQGVVHEAPAASPRALAIVGYAMRAVRRS